MLLSLPMSLFAMALLPVAWSASHASENLIAKLFMSVLLTNGIITQSRSIRRFATTQSKQRASVYADARHFLTTSAIKRVPYFLFTACTAALGLWPAFKRVNNSNR